MGISLTGQNSGGPKSTNMRLVILACQLFGLVMLWLVWYAPHYTSGQRLAAAIVSEIPSFNADTFRRCFKPDRLSTSPLKAKWAGPELYHLQGAQILELQPLQSEYSGGGGIPWEKVAVEHASLLTNKVVLPDVQNAVKAARWSIDTPVEGDGYLHVMVGNFPCARHGLCALPWLLRPNSTDMRSLWNHFLQNEYGLLMEAQHFEPEYILDAGGVGMAPAFLSLLYPRATILRLEPHPSNFHMGVINSLGLPNIRHVNLGLWDKETVLQMCDNVDIDWGTDWPFQGSQQQAYFSREPTDPPCKLVAVDNIRVAQLSSIMQTVSIPRFDLMKVDIEGAELRAFRTPGTAKILSDTTLFMIELHDRMMPGVSKSLVEAFSRDGTFQRFEFDENDMWVKKCAVGLCGSASDRCA